VYIAFALDARVDVGEAVRNPRSVGRGWYEKY
jgi:hypothetical protein